MVDLGIQYIAQFLFSGLVFRAMADGHWTDWTKPQPKIMDKMTLVILSYFCFFEAFVLIIGSFAGPYWAMVIVTTFLVYWFLFSREFY